MEKCAFIRRKINETSSAESQVQLKHKNKRARNLQITVTFVRLIVANHFLGTFQLSSLIHNAHEFRITGAIIGSHLLFKCHELLPKVLRVPIDGSATKEPTGSDYANVWAVKKMLRQEWTLKNHLRALTVTVNFNIVCWLYWWHHFDGSDDIEKVLFLSYFSSGYIAGWRFQFKSEKCFNYFSR